MLMLFGYTIAELPRGPDHAWRLPELFLGKYRFPNYRNLRWGRLDQLGFRGRPWLIPAFSKISGHSRSLRFAKKQGSPCPLAPMALGNFAIWLIFRHLTAGT